GDIQVQIVEAVIVLLQHVRHGRVLRLPHQHRGDTVGESGGKHDIRYGSQPPGYYKIGIRFVRMQQDVLGSRIGHRHDPGGKIVEPRFQFFFGIDPGNIKSIRISDHNFWFQGEFQSDFFIVVDGGDTFKGAELLANWSFQKDVIFKISSGNRHKVLFFNIFDAFVLVIGNDLFQDGFHQLFVHLYFVVFNKRILHFYLEKLSRFEVQLSNTLKNARNKHLVKIDDYFIEICRHGISPV